MSVKIASVSINLLSSPNIVHRVKFRLPVFLHFGPFEVFLVRRRLSDLSILKKS